MSTALWNSCFLVVQYSVTNITLYLVLLAVSHQLATAAFKPLMSGDDSSCLLVSSCAPGTKSGLPHQTAMLEESDHASHHCRPGTAVSTSHQVLVLVKNTNKQFQYTFVIKFLQTRERS